LKILKEKLKDNLLAVGPIVVIVLLLHFTVQPLSERHLTGFLVGSISIIIGLSMFLKGVEVGISQLGTLIGNAIAKSNKIWVVIVSGLILGFAISIAEPGLFVLANQVDLVTQGQLSNTSILVNVSIGLAIMLVLGFLRVFYNVSLTKLLMIVYGLIGFMAFFTNPIFLGIAFDASGATTGILAVPFILSLGVGISKLKKNSVASEEDAFGLVAMASTGAILAVMILNMITNVDSFTVDQTTSLVQDMPIFEKYLEILRPIVIDGITSLVPIFIIFLVMNKTTFKLSRNGFKRIIVGFVFAFLGLIIFFLGVEGGFMEVGYIMGQGLAMRDNNTLVIVVAFFIGFVIMLAEPAVYVLTHQIEEVTSGNIKRLAVLLPLCLGVGLAVALSVVRTLNPNLSLWHFLLPGYLIALLLSLVVPKLFVGIAFDAGGVATGPLTATFTLAFTQGIANAYEGADLLVDGFGMISMVALFPIVTLQILGLIYKIQNAKHQKHDGGLNNESL